MSAQEEDTKYFYVKADPDHYDLEDLFDGKYIGARKEWRFDKNKKEEVTNFLYCSSSESEEGLNQFLNDDEEIDNLNVSEDAKELLLIKRRQRDRLHRANSFNASDESDEEHESIDSRYRRKRPSKRKISVDVRNLRKEIAKIDNESNDSTIKK